MYRLPYGCWITFGDELPRSKQFLKLRQLVRSARNERAREEDKPQTTKLPDKAEIAAALQEAVNWAIARPRMIGKRKAALAIDSAADIPYFSWALYHAGYIQDRPNHFSICLEGWMVVQNEKNQYANEGQEGEESK